MAVSATGEVTADAKETRGKAEEHAKLQAAEEATRTDEDWR